MYRVLGFITGILLIALPAAWLLDWDSLRPRIEPEPRRLGLAQAAASPFTTPAQEPQATAGVTPPQQASPKPEPDQVAADALPISTASARLEETDLQAPPQPAPEPILPKPDLAEAPPPVVDTQPEPATEPPAAEQPLAAEQASASATHLIWSPFRTDIAARGFARRLTRLSDVELDVTKVAPGQYRVGFDYTDAEELERKLERIKSSTGLALKAPQPITLEIPDEDLADPVAATEL